MRWMRDGSEIIAIYINFAYPELAILANLLLCWIRRFGLYPAKIREVTYFANCRFQYHKLHTLILLSGVCAVDSVD
jgi:hypothetical protein